jgi:tRNA-dihydrouridine synthase B
MKEARKHTAWYLKGRPGAAKLRNMCGSLATLEDFDNMLTLIRNTAQQDI